MLGFNGAVVPHHKRGARGVMGYSGTQAASSPCSLQTHGGYAFSRDFHIERKWRETRLYRIAPISSNLILSYVAEKVLKLPRSF